MQFSRPTSSFGYYRGNPVYNGDGAGTGPNVSGSNVFAAGQGSNSVASNWSPTILYLFVLVLVEMFVFAWISRHV